MDQTIDPAGGTAQPTVRDIGFADIRWALAQGWDDFRAHRGDLLLLPAVYVVVGVVAAFVGFEARLFPLLFPVAAGFALVGPVSAAGFYEMARRREAGLESGWGHFLDPLRGRARWPLIGLTLMLAGLFLAWVWSANLIYQQTLGQLAPPSREAFLSALFTTPQGLRLILVGNVVGAIFALVALVVSAFSFPLAVDRSANPVDAVTTSVAVFQRNPLTVLQWGLTVAAILFVAALPLFVGLMVALPVLGYATWHLYTRAVGR
jgi:uncharacterized membrane protein